MALTVDIYKDFGDFQLSAQFEAKTGVLGILGASGCGKSVTLRCIAGVIKPDSGRIELDGTPLFDAQERINLPPQKRHVGLLFQNYALFPNMTVQKNLMAGVRSVEKDKKKAEAAVEEMIGKFYLTGLESHRPFQLSGGQQQRVALARLLLARPKLLMLDEPFSALDGYLCWKLELELMDILKGLEIPVLFVSHSRDEIYRICDYACVMDQGASTPPVPVKAMFEEPKTLAACLLSGCKNYSAADPDRDREGWVFARDWGINLDCGRPVPKDVSYVGVQSHAVRLAKGGGPQGHPNKKPNRIECRVCRIVEDVFNIVAIVKPREAIPGPHNAQIRLEMPKDRWRENAGAHIRVGDMVIVQIDPQDILALKQK